MRNQVELLELLRKELHGDLFESGLCSICQDMRDFYVVTDYEYWKLKHLIYDNRPKDNCGIYFFPIGEIEPRDKFLQELIKEYEK